jgi:molybdopterin-synthase adenylyltransferase
MPELSPDDRARYEWQMWVPGVGETGQTRLKAATVLISRVGGLGGLVALELAAAGVGRLILAHGGVLKPADLNRQLLQTTAAIGQPRMDTILERLRDLNPAIELEGHAANIDPSLAEKLVPQADIVVDAAPLFEERLALNDAAVRHLKPMVECSMHSLEANVTTFIPGRTGCLRCYVPSVPASWKRQFPVFGAVSGTAACIGAMEVIKLITGIGEPLAGHLLSIDHQTATTRKIRLPHRADCPTCGQT